jgi:hypothetical protein
MLTLRTVIEIGHQFPISEDPDFRQEAHLIRLMTKTERGARKAWKEACRRYGYSDQGVQPKKRKQPTTHTFEIEKLRELQTFSRMAFFKPATYRRPKFWARVESVLLPEEKRTLWNWARQKEETITPEVQDVIDTVIVMTMPIL